jgi:cell division protein FtsI/penicillin-binding protein 2
LQQQLEEVLKTGLEHAKSESGSALILEAKTGAIKAMANYPTYNPAEFYKVEDGERFNNAAVSAPLEVGSIMKPLTAGAALDLGVVQRHTTYFDPSQYKIDDATVTNIEEDGGPATHSVQDIIQLSLNTGATWLLMQMGGGEINKQARERWHDYMVNHYQLGKPTGVEQGHEASGSIPDPNEGYGLNIRFANTAFGQGMTATPLQMGAALASLVNGGTYYQPHLVKTAHPKVVRERVVSPAVSQTSKEIMEYSYQKNQRVYGATREYPAYGIGGKTGTAEVAKPEGGYFENVFNGTFMGFVGGNEAEYIIVVRVNRPKIPGYAGSKAAAPIFVNLAGMLLDNFGVTPKR